MSEDVKNDLGGQEKWNKIILGGLFLFVLANAVIAMLFIVKKDNPKMVFDTALGNLLKAEVKKEKLDFSTMKGNMALSLDLESDNKKYNSILKLVNDLDLNMIFEADFDKKIENVTVETKYKNKDLINANMYLKDLDAYLYLDELFDKYIHVPIEAEINFSDFSKFNQEGEIILKEGIEALKNSLKDKYFTSDSITINSKGKEQKVTKNSLVLNKENMENLTKDVLDRLSENQKFLDAASHVSEVTSDEIKESLIQAKNDLNIEDENVVFSILTKGMQKEFVGILVEDNSDKITILKESDSKFTYEIHSNKDTVSGYVEFTINDTEMNIKFNFDVDDIKGTISLDSKFEYDVIVEEKEFSPVIEVDALTDEDGEKIYENLQNNDAIATLIETFSGLFLLSGF